MKILLAYLLILIINLAIGQTVLWERSYNAGGPSDHASGVAVDYEQNIVVTGYKGSGTGYDSVITLKYSPAGSLIWARRFGVGRLSQGMAVAVDRNNNVVVSGYRQTTNSAFLIIKYDKNGTFRWSREYLHSSWDGACGVAVDNNFNIITTGWYSIGDGWRPLTVKFDSSGNFIWARTYLIVGYTVAAKTDGSNNIYVAGFFYPYPPPGDCGFLTIKYDPSGNVLWSQTYSRYFPGGLEPLDGAYGLAVDNNNPIVTGVLQYTNYDCVTIKYDGNGTQLWVRTYDSGNDNGGFGVAADRLNNVIVVGANSVTDLLKYDAGGTLIWQGSHPMSIMSDVATDTLNNFYAVGNNGNDMFIVKYGSVAKIQEESNKKSISDNLIIHPNPANHSISLSFILDKTSAVTLKVYDRSGRQVATIIENTLRSGTHLLRWDGRDTKGYTLPAGVYYIILNKGKTKIYSKLLLVR